MKIISIRLSGFKGIKRGMGKDEFKIDFSALPNGILALVGPNGAGKSTILDNLHPYRIMPSRPGSYYDNCEGMAEKELIFEIDGTVYRSLIFIDCIRKKQESYLYKQNGVTIQNGWIAITDGKAETYDKAIEDIVGSEKIFFSSAFRSQNAKPLSAHTKGELKEIFEQLLLLDEIKAKGELAKEYNKSLLQEQDKMAAKKEELKAILATKDINRRNETDCLLKIEQGEKALREYETAIQSIDDEIRSLERKEIEQAATLKDLERLKHDRDVQQKCIKEIEEEVKATQLKYDAKIFEKEKELAAASRIIENTDDIHSKAKEADDSVEEIEQIKGRLEVKQQEWNLLIAKLDKLQEIRIKRTETEGEIKSIKIKIATAEKGSVVLDKAPCKNNSFTQSTSTKPTMFESCPFIQQARENRDSLVGLHEQEVFLYSQIPKEADNIDSLAKEKEVVTVEIKDLSSQLKFLESKHKNLLKYKDLLPQIEIAKEQSGRLFKEIGELKDDQTIKNVASKQEIAEYKHTIELLERDITTLELTISTVITSQIAELKTKKERSLYILKNAKQGMESYYSDLGAIRERLKNIEVAEKEITTYEEKLKEADKEISEWSILEKALSRDGVIALEIDDAGPAISGMANDLLNSCFGPRFAVKLETTRPKKDGSGTMEVFDIKVIDSEIGEEKSIVDLSGGEKVWIEEAITRAIALYNQQQSGKTVKTLFTDEKDGALDSLRKKEYLKMKKRVLQLGGYEREIFITHSPELQELADGRVEI